jgi:predicted nucleotidyltransferase
MKSTRKELLKSIKSVFLSAVPNGKIILFGSQARGDASKDSDWDLLIILDKNKIESSDFDRISYPLYELGWKEGEQFSPKLYTKKEWVKRSFTPFYKNIEKEGIIL